MCDNVYYMENTGVCPTKYQATLSEKLIPHSVR